MALITRSALLETVVPVFRAQRWRSKINIQKPKPPHHEKAKFLMLTKPYYINPKKDIPLIQLCDKAVRNEWSNEDNPFQRIIAGELLRWFNTSRLTAFFHMNSMSADDQFKAFGMFKKHNMHFKCYGKKTLEMALEGTRFKAVLDFYSSRNMLVFSPEPDIKNLFKVAKKFPQIILLAGIFEGEFISKDELVKFSTIPNLQAAQAQLVHTLTGIGSQLTSHLTTHQVTLVSHLQERIKQLEENKLEGVAESEGT